ncbi:hypothetical protein B0I72DRAFT_138682 [Yarrowia lipolytica]|uniref:Uncharacterized protein n=1 Tax=Yarrowia lipolytica TaxID=4952 RepID=A0A371C2T8_YARLL|nr:hypothetical protein BKA91DRAFT_140675 [Yarrowia lipolytica]KAE8170710.1 hypothetical protein BKA90DRAFT_140308 [Yarrowia lipolytica]RDW24635.1 hypothetical protein B0I71DRAFT_133990 [Yarrowia lipolytica]RDW32083.1 hypothetical protein B0I72DRAFT_138682 [Yarrowia lipolytica]RDW38126.1 hypothetical protein B0I73DRAFT_134284 [Yarrowia lipolytica]
MGTYRVAYKYVLAVCVLFVGVWDRGVGGDSLRASPPAGGGGFGACDRARHLVAWPQRPIPPRWLAPPPRLQARLSALAPPALSSLHYIRRTLCTKNLVFV